MSVRAPESGPLKYRARIATPRQLAYLHVPRASNVHVQILILDILPRDTQVVQIHAPFNFSKVEIPYSVGNR